MERAQVKTKSTDAKRQRQEWGHLCLTETFQAEKRSRYRLDLTIWASNGKTMARRLRRFADALVKAQDVTRG